MENLKGKNIIERMNQLMKYNQTTPKIKEGRNWADLEYSIKAPNGKTYGILRDKTKFYIKESTKENPTIQDFDFIDGVINGSKKHYTNYSHALNYLNLMIAEMNQKNPKAKAINLLEGNYKINPVNENKEKEVDEKTVLKVPKAQPDNTKNMPAQEPKLNSNNDTDLDLDFDSDFDSDGDTNTDDSTNADFDLDGDLDGDNEQLDGGDDVKKIQKLTGKLGQSVRELDEPDPDLTKYVMNSIMSALDLQDLEDKDQKQIMKKLKKKMSGEGEFDKNDDDLTNSDNNSDFGDDESVEQDIDFESDGDKNSTKMPQQKKSPEEQINENKGRIINTYKTISKYFEISPEERKQQTNKKLTETINKSLTLSEGKSKCKTRNQIKALTEVFDYDNFTVKTMNENIILDPNHIIIIGGKEYKKFIMVESSGLVSGILKDTITKSARQYRMANKKDYLNFVKLGK